MIGLGGSRQIYLSKEGRAEGDLEDPSSLDSGSNRPDEPIIDIHQHTSYHGRSDEEMLSHQQLMGITTTILLPAGSDAMTPATNGGEANGLAVGAGGNQECYDIARKHPDRYLFGVNEVPDLPDALDVYESWLERGACMIGELKYGIECDSPDMFRIYELASAYDVPVLMHWEFGTYNHGFERFHKVLEKFSDVCFIGHAQSWWANIDKEHTDQTDLYPDGEVTAGGWTDQLLSDYPNMYGDLSAGSGLNALLRDEEHARDFLDRHQDKLLYGSDCADSAGHGADCQGAQTIDAIRRLAPNKRVERKLLYENAKSLFRL
jgi:predicted TIM-barrel fold metal-dependent hydrolase